MFANELEEMRGSCQPGDLVTVVDHRGRFVGRGFVNPASFIRIRLVTHRDEAVDEDFWLRRLRTAWDLRRRFWSQDAFRVAFAESDGLPGLIADKFGPWLVVQTLALGIDSRRGFLVEALRALAGVEGVYLRNDAPVRELEGLPLESGPWPGSEGLPPRVRIEENGFPFWVDVAQGQKTGHFLDQRLNRAALAPLVAGARVLDAFSYTGGFAVHAARYGAREVVAVESSRWAVEMARENARLNEVEDRCRFEEANAFDFLRALVEAREKFEVVILDPPAFARSHQAREGALRGYKEINLRALRLLEPGGCLVTSSCSAALSPDLFLEVVAEAARDTGCRLALLEARGQPPDHPVALSFPEGRYLKCFFLARANSL